VSTASVHDQWISQARFDRDVGQAGLDHDFGMYWGENANQRVSLRVPAGTDAGVLYVYDPLWNEYLVLGHEVRVRDVDQSFRHVTITRGYQALPLTMLTEAVNDVAARSDLAPLFEMSRAPRSLGDFGIEP